MDSKEAASAHLSISSSGSSSIKNPSYDNEIDAVVKTNGFNGTTKNSSCSIIGGGSSDEGGFVSGEEEFETAPETPFVADPGEATLGKGTEGKDMVDTSVGSSEFAKPRAAMPIPTVSVHDDVEKNSQVGLVGVGEIEKEGIALQDTAATVGNGVPDSVPFDDAVDSKAIGVEGAIGTPAIFSEAMPGENLSLNESGKESGFGVTQDGAVEVLRGSTGDKVVEVSKPDDEVLTSAIVGNLVLEKVELEGGKSNFEEALEDIKTEALSGREDVCVVEAKGGDEEVEESAVSSGDGNQVNSEIAGPTDSKPLEPVDLKFNIQGESGAEALLISSSERGMAVVEEMEEKKDYEIKGVDVPVNSNIEFIDRSDQTSHAIEAVGRNADFNNIEPLTNLIVETEGSEIAEVEADVAGARKDENFEVGAVVTNNMVENNRLSVEENENPSVVRNEKIPEAKIEPEADPDAKTNANRGKIAADRMDLVFSEELVSADGDGNQGTNSFNESIVTNPAQVSKYPQNDHSSLNVQTDGFEDGASGESQSPTSAKPSLILNQPVVLETEDEVRNHIDEEGEIEGSFSDEETDGMIFGSSEAAKQFIEELERGSGAGSHSGAESSHDHSQRIDGQIVTDSDEVDTDEEADGKELFDSSALAALLKAATNAGSDSGSITITSQDESRLFSVQRPAGLGSSLQPLRPASRPNHSNLFSPSSLTTGGESDTDLSEEEKKKLEKLQQIKVKFLRLVQKLGRSPDESIAGQVLYRLAIAAGRQTSQSFSLDAAKRTAMQLEAEGKCDLNFSLNILVLGKSGVGKSATINSIFSTDKAVIDAFEPATTSVKEISGMVDGVKIRVFDTPGLKSSIMEQAFNRRVLSSIKKFTKKNPPDIVLYVDRLDTQTRDLNDLPLLRTITGSLGTSIWRSSIVTLTHAASAPPDGPSGTPLSYEVFVTQRSHVVQQSIGQAVGDLRMMSPSLMNPVSLVENHPSCRKNREGQKVLPNGQSWRPQLLLLCYSMKILSEANNLSKPQDPFDHRKLFGFRVRSPPLPYMLSSMLQPRSHPKLATDQGVENGDSDVDLADLSDSDQEDEEDEYDQLPPFKPLRKAQLAKLSKEQRKAYFEEYDYRVKLLRKKQWREECKRMREIKKKGKDAANDYAYMGEDADQENSTPAPVSVPLPDMVLPPSFDGDNPAHRYRFLEPTSQFLARPVLDTHGWDHDCGYDGVNLEHSLAIASQFPAAVAIQVTKDKKEFSIHLDSSVCAKHGENGSSLMGFDIQNIGKQLAYIIRGETKFKNLKKNKTAAGVSVTFLGENIATGFKIEDQVTLGKQWVLMGSAGTVRSQGDAAYGANFELQHRELDYPIGPVQSTYSMSLIKWRGDWALGFNTLAQFSVGRSSKVAVRAGINNKLSGQITVRTSSSEHLSVALAGVIPVALAIYKKFWPAVGDNYSIY